MSDIAPLRSARLRLSGFFWRHRWAKALLLLAPPLLAFALVYLASLAALFVSATSVERKLGASPTP